MSARVRGKRLHAGGKSEHTSHRCQSCQLRPHGPCLVPEPSRNPDPVLPTPWITAMLVYFNSAIYPCAWSESAFLLASLRRRLIGQRTCRRCRRSGLPLAYLPARDRRTACRSIARQLPRLSAAQTEPHPRQQRRGYRSSHGECSKNYVFRRSLTIGHNSDSSLTGASAFTIPTNT